MITEAEFVKALIQRIKAMLPGCRVVVNDPNLRQGIPDLTIMYRGRYAYLEAKRSARAKHRPNQDYYVNKYRTEENTYAAFIFPENEEEVLHELQQALCS